MKAIHGVDHPVHEIIARRWSPRAFSERPIREADAMSLFEAARWAASCMNGQPWRFIRAAKGSGEAWDKLFSCLTESNKEWAITAPLLTLALARTSFEKDNSPNRWALYDLGLAIGNLTNQAMTMGIYVHNMGGFLPAKARELFSLAPELEPVAMIAIGYPGDPSILSEKRQEQENALQARKPLSELFLG